MEFIKIRTTIISKSFSDWSLRSKLILAVISPVILILLLAGSAYNLFFSNLVNVAQERSYRIQCLAQADVIENILDKCRTELLYLSKIRIRLEEAKAFLEYQNQTGENIYRELAYVGFNDSRRILLWNTGTSVLEIQPDQWPKMKSNPMTLIESLRLLEPGQVKIADVCETSYPNPPNQDGNPFSATVIRLAVPCMKDGGKPEGVLIIGIDTVHLRNVLSLYNSARSPLHVFPQSPELRSSYIFDMQGWMLFQSEDTDDPAMRLSTSRIREGLTGKLGKPDFEGAFLPDADNRIYWKMVSDVRSGNHSLLETDQKGMKTEILGDRYSLVYAPVSFRSYPGRAPEIIFGLAYLDRSRLMLPEFLQPRNFFFMVMISAIVVMILTLRIFSAAVFRPGGKKDSPVPESGVLQPVPGADMLYSNPDEPITENAIVPEQEFPACGGGESRTPALGDAERIQPRNLLEEEPTDMAETPPPVLEVRKRRSGVTERNQGLPDGLSKRQQIIFPVILEKGGITRQEYLELLGDGFSIRIAQYDLDMMVKKGYLNKNGKGQSAHYYPAVGSRLFRMFAP